MGMSRGEGEGADAAVVDGAGGALHLVVGEEAIGAADLGELGAEGSGGFLEGIGVVEAVHVAGSAGEEGGDGVEAADTVVWHGV